MGTVIKWLLGLVLVLVVLVIAAVIVLPMVIDPNDYKPQIVEAVKEHTGRDLVIEQDLELSVFPWLGIETGGVRLGNAAGFEAESFAAIEKLGIKVRLVPLLSRRVEVDTLVLEGLRLNLEKDAQGRTNWDDLAARDTAEPADDRAPAGERRGPVAFSVQGVRIEDARIAWHDRQAGEQYVLDGVRVVTGALAPGATVPVEAGVTFTSTQPAMTLQAALEAEVSSDAGLAAFRIADLVLELDAEGEGVPGGSARLTVKADVAADTAADTLTVERLEISGPAMAAQGTLAVSALQTRPAIEGTLSIAETNPKTLAAMFASPIETTDPDAMTKASGDLDFAYADGALKLEPMTIRLDESRLTGYVHLLDPAGPVVRTKMELDTIDLDRYMPPAGETQAGTDTGEGGGVPADDPFAALRTLDFEGEFKVGALTVSNARMSNVTSKVTAKQGVLKIDPMGAQLYQGDFTGRVVLDASAATPKVQAVKHLTGIQIGPLLKDVVGEDRLLGSGEWHVDVRLAGLSEAEIRRTLNGTSRFAFRDGALKGVNLAEIIRQASSALGLSGGAAATGTPGQTDFTELSGSLTITDGVIRNDDLQAKSPLLRVDGTGEVNLPQDTIDYRVTTELVGTLEGQGGKARDELAGIPIPVRVTGPLDNPKYRPDLEAALSAKAKEQLDAKKAELTQKVEQKVQEKIDEKLKGDIGEKLKGEFGDKLKGLFN